MNRAVPLNACELEIDLFCRGLRLPADVSLAGARSVSRTRAGLGSGLELIIPTGSHLKPDVWVNVPVVEPFAQSSPYRLDRGVGGQYRIVDDRAAIAYNCACRAPPTGTRDTRRTTRRCRASGCCRAPTSRST